MMTRRVVLGALPVLALARRKKRDAEWKNTITISANTFGTGRGFHTIVPTAEGFAIADYFGQSIARFDQRGGYLGDIGTFPELSALAYDGNYYAGFANNIKKVAPDGTVLARYGHPDWNVWYWCASVDGGRLYLTSNDGYVYVHDSGTLDLLTRLGNGLGDGGYGYLGRHPEAEAPRAITPHGGSLWIADPGNDLVQKWGMDGTFLSQFDVPRDSGIRSLVFSGESMWITHEFANKAVRYSQSGKVLETIKFTESWGLCLSPGGRIWISSDSPGREIRAFEKR